MGDFLMGKEVSGTPLETRGLSRDVAGQYGQLLDPSNAAQRIASTFGINPSLLGLQDFASGILSGKTDLSGWDAANRPFQERAINQSNRNLQNTFGTAGGRFSGNLQNVQAMQQGELESQFNRDRFNFAQQQRGMDIQTLATLFQGLPALMQGSLMPLQQAGAFASPGAPIMQEGALGSIIGAAGDVIGAKMGIPPGVAPNPFAGGVGSQRQYTPAPRNSYQDFWRVNPNWYGSF